jgi:hypothetical protein
MMPGGNPNRSLTIGTLEQWHVSPVHLPAVRLFDASGQNLSKIGTDAQLLSAGYNVTQQWALRLAAHPAAIDGIYYPSRHNPSAERGWRVGKRASSARAKSKRKEITFGSASRLADYPGTLRACIELEVAILPSR